MHDHTFQILQLQILLWISREQVFGFASAPVLIPIQFFKSSERYGRFFCAKMYVHYSILCYKRNKWITRPVCKTIILGIFFSQIKDNDQGS